MQLIHFPLQLGRALRDEDGSGCLIDFKGSITPWNRHVTCDSAKGHKGARRGVGLLSGSQLPCLVLHACKCVSKCRGRKEEAGE